MSEFDKEEHECMENGYMFLIHAETPSEAMRRHKKENICYPFQLDEIMINDIKLIMHYFSQPNIEQYEKSQEIKNLLSKIESRK